MLVKIRDRNVSVVSVKCKIRFSWSWTFIVFTNNFIWWKLQPFEWHPTCALCMGKFDILFFSLLLLHQYITIIELTAWHFTFENEMFCSCIYYIEFDFPFVAIDGHSRKTKSHGFVNANTWTFYISPSNVILAFKMQYSLRRRKKATSNSMLKNSMRIFSLSLAFFDKAYCLLFVVSCCYINQFILFNLHTAYIL